MAPSNKLDETRLNQNVHNVGFSFPDCLQCYSCKATGTNELDANIRCLEQAYLENCEEFYDYYNQIEDQDVISYEYYYYDKGNEEEPKDAGKVSAAGQGQSTRKVFPAGSQRSNDREFEDNDRGSFPTRRNKRATKERSKKEKEVSTKNKNKVGFQ